ncbi:squalene/phytoene synthase family protein [Martelella radicis]|uniref:Phytoene synthase n=1 Tax=Martelella radicis TaxID=1397476 RepID=A0A7W6P955_9HYPH|nr:phytoene synthase [Martelella radicis]
MTDHAETETLLLAELREADRDRYLAALLSPADKRQALVALYLFNAELARVRERVSEPLPGEVRLQYWRDLLEGADHGSTAANPTAAALLEAIETHHLPRDPLVRMSEARIFDLYDDPMGATSEFEGYAGETASALIQLASLVLDPKSAAASATAAGHAGVAQAVAGSILLLPRHRAAGQVFVPTEILGATGLDRESFLIASDRERVGNAIRAFAAFGRSHLEKFRAEGPVAKTLAPAYLPMSALENILVKAEALGENALEHTVRPSQWKRQLAMMRSLLFRKF